MLVAIVCGIYYPSLGGGFLLDDDLLITQNKLIHQPHGLWKIWFTTEPTDYWPLTNSVFWLEWRLWGNSPNGYRITNLVLHIADVLLLWAVLARLAIPGAFLAALLFAVHPVNVESVAWIAQLKNLLALLFGLLSIYGWLLAQDIDATDQKQRAQIAPSSNLARHRYVWNRWYSLSIAAFTAAMLSKGSVAVLPLLLLLIAWWQRRLTKLTVARTVPFFLVAIALTVVNIWFQSHDMQQVVREATLLQRLLGAGAIIWFYLSKALLPMNLSFVYPQWHISVSDWRWWLPLVAAIALTGFLYWKRNIAPCRASLFAWLFFCVALLPVMGFTDVSYMQWSLVADHYQHLALIAVTTLAAAALTDWRQRTALAKWIPRAVTAAAVLSLSALTVRESALYGDAAKLYASAIEQNAESAKLYTNLGNALAADGKYADAIEGYRQALRIESDNVEALDNLAAALANSGRSAEAQANYQSVLKSHPDDAAAHNNLARLLFEQGNLDEAIVHFQQAADARPDLAEYRSNLGRTLLRAGKYHDAADALERALQIDPNLPNDRDRLLIALVKSGQTEKAMKLFPQAFRLKSNPAKSPTEPQPSK
ncbi:MAG TPA: tetratricopeptide repeat protein [Pirellulales bacterium]